MMIYVLKRNVLLSLQNVEHNQYTVMYAARYIVGNAWESRRKILISYQISTT